MVRNYKRTSTRQNWPEESMRYAIKEVIEQKKSISCAANEYNLPYAALYDKIKKIKTYTISKLFEKLTGNYNKCIIYAILKISNKMLLLYILGILLNFLYH